MAIPIKNKFIGIVFRKFKCMYVILRQARWAIILYQAVLDISIFKKTIAVFALEFMYSSC